MKITRRRLVQALALASSGARVAGIEAASATSAVGAPLIFVPGLACGAWAWQATADAFSLDRKVRVVTLAGFSGAPPAGPRPLAAAEQAVFELIEREHLARPILIGHSLGGTLALQFAERHPHLLGGVVSLDGLPVFEGTEQLDVDERAVLARKGKASVPLDPTKFRKAQAAFMTSPGGVIDPATAQHLATLTGMSDPASVAAYVSDVLELDLRRDLPGIAVPVLLLMPFDAADGQGSAFAFTEQQKIAYYRSLMAGTPKLDVTVISPARHFAMFDQPSQVETAIRNFAGAIEAHHARSLNESGTFAA